LTYWLELLVDEELRDIVEREGRREDRETVENAFARLDPTEWTKAYRGNPHTAKFLTEDGRALRVKFWLKINPDICEPYENPLIVDEKCFVIVTKR